MYYKCITHDSIDERVDGKVEECRMGQLGYFIADSMKVLD